MVSPVMAESAVLADADDRREAERLSAIMDGELAPGDLEGLIRACEAEPDLAGDWAAYHCIGDVLRSADMGCHSERLSQAVFDRLEHEPVVLAPRAARRGQVPRWRAHAGRVAAIAAVAVVGGVMVPRWTAIQEPVARSALVPPVASAPSGALASPDLVLAPAARPAGIPREYLAAHRQASGSLAMQGVMSRVRSVPHDPGQ